MRRCETGQARGSPHPATVTLGDVHKILGSLDSLPTWTVLVLLLRDGISNLPFSTTLVLSRYVMTFRACLMICALGRLFLLRCRHRQLRH